MLKNLYFNFVFYLIAVTNSSKFSELEKRIIVDLSKTFTTNHLFIINNEPHKNFDLVKYLSKLNMQTGFMSINETAYYFYKFVRKKVNKPHVIMILDLENLNEPLAWLFNYNNEYFFSNYIWITFNAMELNFTNVYIPYNCEFLDLEKSDENTYEILEIYSPKVTLEGYNVLSYGIWTVEHGLDISMVDFYNRRIDLNGTVMEAVIDSETDDCFNPGMCAYQEIIQDISRVMNFRMYYVTDMKYQEMSRQNITFLHEMNVALYVFHIDAFSKDMVAPIWRTPAFLHIGYRSIYEQGAKSAHVQPFKPEVWLVIVLWLLISGMSILLTKYLVFKYKLKQKFIITYHLFLSLDSFTNQCGSLIPKIATFRMAVIMTRLAPFLIIPVYSAAVLSFITVRTIYLPFEDIEGLVNDGTFKIGYENETFSASFFMQAKDPVIKTAYEKYVVGLDDMPLNGYQGLLKMCKDRKFSFVYFNNDIYRYRRVCTILQIPKSVFVSWDGFHLRFNSPYKAIFNRILKTLRSSGILKYMEKIVYGVKPSRKTESDLISVDFSSVLLLFKIAGSWYLISMFIFVFECLYGRSKNISKNLRYQDLDSRKRKNNFRFTHLKNLSSKEKAKIKSNNLKFLR